MNDSKEDSTDRFHLAGRRTTVNIKVNGISHPLETRLHLINFDGDLLTSILFLTSSNQKENWLAGFDLAANKVCYFTSKREVVTAVNCLLDSFKYTEKLGANIDIPLCRSLIQQINQESEIKAKEAITKLIDVLNVNILAGETVLRNIPPSDDTEAESTIRKEQLSLSLKIGKQELVDGLLSMLRIGGQEDEDTLIIRVDTNITSNLNKIDYSDNASFSIDIGQGLKAIFGGIVSEADLSDDRVLTITCRSYALTLKDTIIPGLSMRISGGAEKIYYLLRSSRWPLEQLRIDGLYTGNKSRFFVILTPITNIISDRPFGIGDVTFSKLDEEYKSYMKSLNLEESPNYPNMEEDVIWAKTYVSSLHFYEAQEYGLKKIEMALDLLSDVKSDSRPFHYSDRGDMLVSWRRSDRLARVTRRPWVYIQDVATKESILANTEYIIDEKKINMTPALLSRLEIGTDKIQILFQKSWEELNIKEKSIVYALHWLHRAREEGTDIDKLIYLWNAIEFISSSSKPTQLFSKEEIKTITKLVEDSLSIDDAKLDKKKKRINDVIAMLNDASLLFKLRQLTESAQIDISEDEWEHIRKSRKKRNSVLHGKTNVDFNENDINKLSFVVSKIISGLSLKL